MKTKKQIKKLIQENDIKYLKARKKFENTIVELQKECSHNWDISRDYAGTTYYCNVCGKVEE
jgi:hypothetical protein